MSVVNILFEDDFLVIVDKPSGVAIHRGQGHEDQNLLDLLRAQLAQRGAADVDELAPVHRLDRDTSGIVAFGRSAVVTRSFHEALAKGEVRREYLALVQGVAHRKGTIRVPLARPGRRPGTEEGEPQEAETRYRRLRYSRTATLLRVRPRTGRPHQIRRHLKSIGHPVAGDERWGDVRFNRWIQRHHLLTRMFLHAAALSFPHPISGIPLTLRAPLPSALVEVLASLGFEPLSEADDAGDSGPTDTPGAA